MKSKTKIIFASIIFVLFIQTLQNVNCLDSTRFTLCDTTDDIYASNILDPDEINLESNRTTDNKAIDIAYIEYYGNTTTAFMDIHIIDLTYDFNHRDLPFWYYINFDSVNFITLKLNFNYSMDSDFFPNYIINTDNWVITADRTINLEINLKIYSPDVIQINFNNIDNKLTETTDIQLITVANKTVAQGLYYGFDFCWDFLPNLDGFIYNVKDYCEMLNLTDYFIVVYTVFPIIILINLLIRQFGKKRSISNKI